MSAIIHPTAIVDPGARLGHGVKIGPYAIIGPHVVLGDGCDIGAHSVIDGRTTLGREVRVFPHAAVGLIPQDLKYHGEPSTLTVGDRTQIREFSTLHPGTEGGGMKTEVGSDGLLMAYSHVAHDCILGDRVILANAATLAGHVTVESGAIIGGLTAIHQFVRVGEGCMVGGASAVVMDIPPYTMASGNRAELHGLNSVGLKRSGSSDDEIAALKRAYRLLFRGEISLKEAVFQLQDEHHDFPRLTHLLDFLAACERGVTR